MCSPTDADELEPPVEQIFDAMHDLYVKWKARSFLLIDMPPLQRSPGGTVQYYIFINLLAYFPYQPGIFLNIEAERYDTWNEQLLVQAATFAKSASKASVFVVSALRIFAIFFTTQKNLVS